MNTKFDYIDSDAQLIAFSRKIAAAKWLAVDTEFMRERTYYAQLALIQITCDAGSALIDAPALNNLDPLVDVFTRPDCLKIMHSASQDLEVLYQAFGQMPSPLFDTQIAASFLGEPDQIAYAAIVKQRLGIEIEKDQTRTNWLQRPLSTAQLVYAEADVLYLYALYQGLVDELSSQGRLAWVEMESQSLADKTRQALASELAWQRVKSIAHLKPEQQQTAIALANWREKRAQKRDMPREWVLKKQLIMTLAKAQPATLQQLKSLEGASEKMVQSIGRQILQVIEQTDQQGLVLSTLTALTSAQRGQAKNLMLWLRQRGEALKIAPSLIANRKAIEQLVLGERDLALLEGWRAEIAGKEMLDQLNP